MAGVPLVPGATVEHVPLISGHGMFVAFIPQVQHEVAQGKFAGMSTPSFVLEIVRVDVLVDFGGNLRKWRRQLEMLKGEVVWALELVEEELFESGRFRSSEAL